MCLALHLSVVDNTPRCSQLPLPQGELHTQTPSWSLCCTYLSIAGCTGFVGVTLTMHRFSDWHSRRWIASQGSRVCVLQFKCYPIFRWSAPAWITESPSHVSQTVALQTRSSPTSCCTRHWTVAASFWAGFSMMKGSSLLGKKYGVGSKPLSTTNLTSVSC